MDLQGLEFGRSDDTMFNPWGFCDFCHHDKGSQEEKASSGRNLFRYIGYIFY